jgi:hypothetical protein
VIESDDEQTTEVFQLGCDEHLPCCDQTTFDIDPAVPHRRTCCGDRCNTPLAYESLIDLTNYARSCGKKGKIFWIYLTVTLFWLCACLGCICYIVVCGRRCDEMVKYYHSAYMTKRRQQHSQNSRKRAFSVGFQRSDSNNVV